eukprot:5705021-Pleurochrysis_carterae.AAC.1
MTKYGTVFPSHACGRCLHTRRLQLGKHEDARYDTLVSVLRLDVFQVSDKVGLATELQYFHGQARSPKLSLTLTLCGGGHLLSRATAWLQQAKPSRRKLLR